MITFITILMINNKIIKIENITDPHISALKVCTKNSVFYFKYIYV
jgi:hypothetical protein